MGDWLTDWNENWPQSIKDMVNEYRRLHYWIQNTEERVKRSDSVAETEDMIEDLLFFKEALHTISALLLRRVGDWNVRKYCKG